MGDRISISFKNGDEESVALFSHGWGMLLADEARDYAWEHVLWSFSQPQNGAGPSQRLEPATVLVNFIRFLADSSPEPQEDFHLGRNSEDGDNSDHGHYAIDLGDIAERLDEYREALRPASDKATPESE